MSNLTDVPLIRCVVLGDDDRLDILRRYADLSGLPFDDEVGEVITAFNGQKCQFLDATSFGEKGLFYGEIHAILMCVSVARKATVEETVRMVMETILSIGSIPFVLVGTEIDKRTKMLREGEENTDVLPMSLSQAETFAKRIGASKYLECSAATGEGLDEVFEDACEIGRKFAVEQLRIVQRKKSGESNNLVSSMADHVNDDDDLMFGEMPEDDDLNGAGGDESEIDANNDETFGGPLPTSNANVELEDYATQTADLNLDDIWDIPSCSAAAPPASDLPMPSSFFTNFGENSFDFLGSGSKVWGQSKTDDYSWPDMPSLPSHYEKTPLDLPPVAMPSIQQMTPLQQSALPPVIPTMPKAPTLHEIERMQVEESRARQIPAIPSTAMSSEELEKKILQESRANNQVNGTPAMSIPPLMGNVPRNPMALGLCPPIPPIFVPCFAPWLDLLMRRTQSLPPGCPPPPPFVLGLMNRFGNPNMVMNIMRSAVTPPGMPPTFVPPPISHLSSTAITPSYHHYHRKPPGMPSAKTIEDLAFDQFAGYMSIKERQWLVKIQILQCQGTNNPYEDDYYYVCWRQKKIAEGMQPKEVKDSEKSETKEIINGSRQARRNRERKESTCEREPVDRVTTLATRFAGSLGIPTKASTHNPRHSIRVQHSEPLDEDQEKRAAGSQKKLRTLLMKIEGATSLLIECQDRRVALQNATSQANRDALVQEISERVSTVMKETFQEEFYRVMQVSKGRALISRVVRVGMPADVCRMIRLLIAQSRVTQNAKYLPDVEEGVFPSIYRGLMTFPREDILAILSSPILKINDLQIALSEKNTFARDLLFLLLLVCSVKKVSISCHLFDWVRSIAPLDLSSGWSFSETALWNLLSVGRDDVHNLASWLCHLVSENSHGTVASQIAQRLRLY